MIEIRLQKDKWSYDPEKPLGQAGGFGAVFEGYSEERGQVAIKRLHMSATDAAHRELDIAELLKERSSEHIIPVFDSGLDAESDSYFLVMAMAENSLQDHIDASETLGSVEAAQILLEIVSALQDVPDLTHRDLKPQNILRQDDKWKVADFGIARFVEQSTSDRTLNEFWSPLYAAPEQWNFERSTTATDVYALGGIAYALLTGSPPFQGSSREQLKAEHLSGQQPTLDAAVDSRLRSLTMTMLRKSPEARPSLERIANVLTSIAETLGSQADSPVFQRLGDADAAIQQRRAEEEAKREQEKRARDQRNHLAREALKILENLRETLFQKIMKNAPSAEVYEAALTLGGAQLMVAISSSTTALPPGVFEQSNWDTITGGRIGVIQDTPVSYVWESSLWYAKLPETADYRWYEVSYYAPSGRRSHPRGFVPFALDAKEADLAAGPAIHSFQRAFGPLPIDDEDAEDFYHRWAFLLAQGTEGKLSHPKSLPLTGGWYT